jgi:hypothetical protein
MAARPFNSATVVLGMHRSGTSALAGALRLCGLAVPNTLIEASQANERGFWEPAAVKALDDEALTRFGLTWHSLVPIDFDRLGKREAAQFRKRASEILSAEYSSNSHIVLKEPRLCRLMPLWAPALQQVAERVAYALVIRHPIEVARSLAQRNGFDLNHALLLWARYSLDAEFHTRGQQRVVISYSDLLQEVGSTMAALAQRAKIPIEIAGVDMQALEEYLAPDLRHQREPDEGSLAGKPAEIVETYTLLRRWSEGHSETGSDHERLDAVREQLDRTTVAIADIFESARRDRKRSADAQVQLDRSASITTSVQQSLDALQQHLARSLSATDERLSAVAGEISNAAREMGRTQEERFGSVERSLDKLGAAVGDAAARDRDIAAAIMSTAAEQGGVLADISAKVAAASQSAKERALQLSEIVARGQREQALRLSALASAIEERRKLEDALAQAIRSGAEAAARLDRAESAAAEAADEFARSREQLEAERRRTLDELKAREESLEQQQARAEMLDEELQRTKRKYRAAQWDVERERRAHDATRNQLAAAEAIVARFQASLPWRGYTKLAGLISRVSAGAKGRTPATRKRRTEQLQAIESSGLFDRDWYLVAYPDVAAAGVEPLEHFFDLGWREGRDPGPGFATSAYLKANPDVARTAINPLFHYIEFGRSEGREVPAHRAPADKSAAQVHDFPPAAQVFRGEVPLERPIRWAHSYRLAQDDPRLVAAGTLMVGYSATPAERIATEAAFERLAALSGLPAPVPIAEAVSRGRSAALIDAWYTSTAELRTRWRDNGGPFVIRAYQHDPLQDGRLVLVGEGLVASELDVLDSGLTNAYFPLLFVFADCEGTIRGTRLMPFPSLCRGGLHYSELVAASSNTPDPIKLGETLSDRLLAARDSSDRLVCSLSVQPHESSGSSPFEDHGFLKWLECVARVPVRNSSGGSIDGERAATGGNLVLAPDMVPTISILSELGGSSAASERPLFLPLLIAGDEPSQPATLIELPRGASMILGVGASGYPAPWPRFVPGSPGHVPLSSLPAAIRLPNGREISDSDLLVPCPGPALALASETSADLTWLIRARDWRQAELVQTIRALSLQSGAESHVIGFIGEVDALARTVAQEFFADRVRFFADFSDAAQGIETGLTGHLGPGVILHDRRSVSVLAALLSDAGIISAACILVTTEKRGKAWHAALVDGGSISLDLCEGRTMAGQVREAILPWRASFPVSRPPRDFWVARSSSVKSWLASGAPEPLRKGMHVATSLVTASYLSARAEHVEEVPLPSASAGRSTRTRTLFG